MFICQQCGGKVIFDIDAQNMKCLYCGTLSKPSDFDEKNTRNTKQYETNVFICNQCGAEVTTPDNQVVGYCSYCGSQSVMFEKTVSSQRPKDMIPFRLSRKIMHGKYAEKFAHVWYLPKEFKDPKYIDSMRGIYIPFWANSVAIAPGAHVKVSGQEELGGDRYVVREFDATVNAQNDGFRYYKDASSALDDNITRALLPFPEQQMTPFNPAYLAGFYADQPDVPPQKYMAELVEEASSDAIAAINRTLRTGYSVKLNADGRPESGPLPITCKDYHASLLPVWFLTRRDKDRVSYAVANGVNGRIYADMPVDSKKYWLVTLGIAAAIFLVLNLFISMTAIKAATWCMLLTSIMMFVFQGELRKVMERETHLFDVGSPYYDPVKAARAKKKNKTASASGCLTPLVFIILWITVDFFLESGSDFSPAVQLFSMAFGIIQLINIIKHSNQMKSHSELLLSGLLAFICLLFSFFILLADPVRDVWYYIACISSLLGALIPGSMMIRCYNLTASHPLPNYFRREGGVNDAK